MRGTSNSNDRGNSRDRLRRRVWLMKAWASDIPAHVRCYRCGVPLSIAIVTVDRIKPGVKGGRYVRNNIRPACSFCNSATGVYARKP